jgi:hypothetical protein
VVDVEVKLKSALYKTNNETLVEEFLQFICEQNKLEFRLHTLAFLDGTALEMDRTISSYTQPKNGLKPVFKVIEGPKVYGTMVVSENDMDVMIFKTVDDKYDTCSSCQ